MSDEKENLSLIERSTGGLSRIANTFINKFSPAIKKLPPIATRLAKGEVAAMEIKAEGMVAVSEKLERAGYRIVWKEGNIESIARKAEEYMSPDEREEKAKNLNQDWAVTFADKCGNTSDEEMQEIWAKILAGETDIPGTFSKRTLDIVGKLDTKDAELFTSLCQFIWRDDDDTPRVLIYQKDHRRENSIYQLKGINFDTLENLESMGLVRCSFGVQIGAKNLDKEHKTWHYHDIPVKIKGILTDMEIEGYCIPVGHVILTQSGRELFPISGASRNDEFFNYVINIWQKGGHDPVVQTSATQ